MQQCREWRSLVPEEVGGGVAAQSAAGQADGLRVRHRVLGQVRRGHVARLLGVGEAVRGRIAHHLRTAGSMQLLMLAHDCWAAFSPVMAQGTLPCEGGCTSLKDVAMS